MSHFLDCSKEALALARPYRWPGGPWHAGGKLPDQPLPVGPSRPLAWEGEVTVPAPEGLEQAPLMRTGEWTLTMVPKHGASCMWAQ